MAASVSREPSISSRMPVSIGSVSSRPAATATCATACGRARSAAHRAGELRHRRQLRVVLDRHRRQAEPAVAAVDRGAGPVDDQVDRLGRQRAGDVGQQPPGDEHPAGIADRRVELDPGGGLVVEAGDGQAVAVGTARRLDEHAAQHRDRGPRRAGCGPPTRPRRPGRRVRPGTSWRGPLALAVLGTRPARHGVRVAGGGSGIGTAPCRAAEAGPGAHRRASGRGCHPGPATRSGRLTAGSIHGVVLLVVL